MKESWGKGGRSGSIRFEGSREEFEVVDGDFGLAKILDHKDSHVTTALWGTVGHIVPECLATRQRAMGRRWVDKGRYWVREKCKLRGQKGKL